ncbi:MAG: DUF2793 domain-containing protein [Novosphingobium sp.]|jgi:hypothetical protein
MPDPIALNAKSARLGLPFLYSGQSQKEVFVNEALVRLDALLHCVVEGIENTPPASAEDGKVWLVGPEPTGPWAGQPDRLALQQAGGWIFLNQAEGMRVTNRLTSQDLRYVSGQWKAASPPATPTAGTVVDTELRTSFAALVSSLRDAGIFGQEI